MIPYIRKIISDLPVPENEELPPELTAICANLLNQYIIEDRIPKEDKEDRRLEKLMRFSEAYFIHYMRVVALKESKGVNAIRDWQTSSNDAFIRHAKTYQPLYAQVAHMSGSPYFMTNWSMCFLVVFAMEASGITTNEAFAKMTPEQKSELDYVLRFGENLLQTFYSKVMTG